MPAISRPEPSAFADVYDALYDDAAFRAAQIAYLSHIFGAPPRRLLDAGCGTGGHLDDLIGAGYTVVGLDVDPRMVRLARDKLMAAGQPATLVQGDLRALPFTDAFDGILCLESPLAYLLTDEDLAAALTGFHRSLRGGGRLIVDVFDYLGTLGEEELAPQTNRFTAPWGSIVVREAHRYERHAGFWIMRQEFRVNRGRSVMAFSVEHRLRIRFADDYASALEDAGFTIAACQTAYPGTPSENEEERRLIFVAQATG